MLSILRKHAASTLIKIILALIIIVFIFWGFEGFNAGRAGRVAVVNGESISIDEYRQAYNNLLERYRQQFGGQIDEEMLEAFQLKQQALDMLINQRLMLAEAEKLNIRVSDQELADYIRNVEAFQEKGVFDKQRYQNLLQRIRTTPEEFEMQQRQYLLVQKVQEFITGNAKVSDNEIREFFDWNNASRKIKYVEFSSEKYDVEPPDQETLKAYFEQNQEAFRTKPLRQVVYVNIQPEDYFHKAEITNQEIRQYYDEHPDEFTEEKTVEARHILIRLDEQADQSIVEEKRQEILSVLEKARAGQDFAELAEKYSEGPTKDNGGYLGAFPRGSMVKAFEDAAFSMEEGQISEPVRTRFGWHIIKVERVNEEKIRTFEEVEEQIRNQLLESRARVFAKEAAESVYEASFLNEDLADIAENHGIGVTKTGFFDDGGPEDKNIGDRKKFAETAFSLSHLEISGIQKWSNGFYLMQLIARKDSKIPDFSEIMDDVQKKYIQERQHEAAQKDAENFLEKLKEQDSAIETLAQEFGVSVSQSGFFKRNQPVPGLENQMQISSVAFELSDRKKYPDSVLRGENGFYVIAFQDRQKPSGERFDQEKETIRQQLIRQKQTTIFEQWMTQIRDKSEISINNELIAG